MKRSLMTVIVLAMTFVFLGFSTVSAQQSSLLYGQKHYYTVMMREDKQSLVYAKITFQNSSESEDLKSFNFHLPDGVKVSNLAVQQVVAKSIEKNCKRWETPAEYRARDNTFGSSDYYYQQYRKCLEFNEVSTYDDDYDFDANMSNNTDYYVYGYYANRFKDSKYEYSDLVANQKSNTYSVSLAKPIKPKKQGAILVSYSSKDFISGAAGRYSYNFRTLTASQIIDRSVVAINFDEELYSKNTSSKRETSNNLTSDSIAQGAGVAKGYESRSMDDLSRGVGQGGRYVKEKSQLLPNETFAVKGVFATSLFMLNFPVIIWTIVILTAIVLAGVFFYRKYRKNHPRQARVAARKDLNKASSKSSEAPTVQSQLSAKDGLLLSLVSYGLTIVTILVSFIAAFLLGVNGYYSSIEGFVILLGVVLCIVSMFVLPTLFVIRFGAKAAFKWLLWHSISILVLMLVVALITAAIKGAYGGGVGPVYY